MTPSLSITVFSSRRAQLEDARATALAILERELFTEEMAAEFRLLDFLAEAFAEYDCRFRLQPSAQQQASIEQYENSTPQEYGDAMAPAFLDVLKDIAGKRRRAAFDEILSLPWELLG